MLRHTGALNENRFRPAEPLHLQFCSRWTSHPSAVMKKAGCVTPLKRLFRHCTVITCTISVLLDTGSYEGQVALGATLAFSKGNKAMCFSNLKKNQFSFAHFLLTLMLQLNCTEPQLWSASTKMSLRHFFMIKDAGNLWNKIVVGKICPTVECVSVKETAQSHKPAKSQLKLTWANYRNRPSWLCSPNRMIPEICGIYFPHGHLGKSP